MSNRMLWRIGGPRALPVWMGLMFLLLSGCATRPDLSRLYEGLDHDPNQPPVIVIHGLAGSTLVEASSGKEFFPGSLGTLTFSDYRDLAQMSSENREGEGLVPGRLFTSVAGVDFYGELLHSLETVGHFQRGVPGQPVTGPDNRRRYYAFLYDWRRDNVRAARKLHELIEQIRLDYQDPNLRVDIIAHSNGGTIANYYLRYGPRDVLNDASPTPWDEGDKRIRRLVMLGTPTLGAATSIERLMYGMRIAVRTVPVEVMATFVTPFEALPHPLAHPILDAQGNPVDLDIYDPQLWRSRQWGVYSPEVIARVRDSMGGGGEGDKAVADLHAQFDRNLVHARRMALALSAPLPVTKVEVAVFGGDCDPTPGHGILVLGPTGERVVFRAGQVDSGVKPGQAHARERKFDYDRLLFEPGDGLVPRASQVGKLPLGTVNADSFHPLPITQTFFLCESHGRLTHNAYFQNNLLYFLMAR